MFRIPSQGLLRPFAALCVAAVLAAATPLATATSPPALMLASELRGEPDVRAYFVSEKLDGVRGHWDGEALWTRGGHRIATPPGFTRGWPATPMDGELWIARGRFDAVSAVVRRRVADPEAWAPVRFMVFDLPDHPGRFADRIDAMRALVAQAGHPHLALVEQAPAHSRAALDAQLAHVVAAGGEGLMLHHRDARYVAGRSAAVLKFKPHDDAEARVVGHTPGTGKYAGMLGALVVEHVDGRQFRIGTGFTDAQRAAPPPPGSWVTYRYNGLTSTGLPRFARFLRVRDEMPP